MESYKRTLQGLKDTLIKTDDSGATAEVNPHLPRGIGDKMLLRALAASLHLDEAACRPKRAMQFRTRVVRAEEDHAKGGDICQKLMDVSV
ncbi:hypothetical protein HPB51_007757 [Rhipicephalus microplus]|uniref:Uncharacterized protein n=1 Tax=Rhipicephalus microplus TaxID=6941 RepID=A0A9J6EMJ4_RHIMP|nr:hypothetical protein HPB51_007757 [Rhipicephalus microplus]